MAPGGGRLLAKSDRFELLRAAQRFLYRKEASHGEQARVCWCHRAPRGEAMSVWRAEDGSNARLAGVTTCGSVWHCPVCSAKVCEQRREELSGAMVQHVGQGGAAYLITLTFPHEADQSLAELLPLFAKALQSFRNSRQYKAIMRTAKDDTPAGTAGSIGFVRSLEVTVGQANGWHPHTHELVFARSRAFGEGDADDEGNLTSRDIDTLKGAWVKALVKVGLCDGTKVSDAFTHGLNVRGGEKAAEYIAKFGRDQKWGASSELTRPHSKIGERAVVAGDIHVTPFQLLAWAAEGDAWAISRWREYAFAFEGKRMLVWSNGLRKRLALGDERADEDIAADDTALPDEHLMAHLEPEGLSVLVSRGLLGQFHAFVATYCTDPATGQEDVDDYLTWARLQPVIGRGTVLQRRTFAPGRDAIDYTA